MAKKKTDSASTQSEKTKGMVFYTDGGVRPTNPGYGGYGFHGYVYSDQDPKKGSGNPNNLVTDVGYLLKSRSDKVDHKVVKAMHYVNGYGTIPGLVTNNVAEITAATWALEHARAYNVDSVTVITDSKGVVEAATSWISKWSQNGWIKSDGNPVANQGHWKILDSHVKHLQNKGVSVDFKWIKGHDGHLGNEISDKLATLGVMKARKGLNYSAVDLFPADGFWTQVVDKHPLIAQRRLYMTTDPATVVPGEYYLGNHGKDDDMLAVRTADGYFSYVELVEPDPIIESVRMKQIDVCAGHVAVVMLRLDKVFEKDTHMDLHRYGPDCLHMPSSKRFDLFHIESDQRSEPVSKEARPPLLAWRAVEALNLLKTAMIEFKANNPKFVRTDITSAIFDVDEKKQVHLKVEFDSGFVGFKTPANYGSEGKSEVVELTLGVDLPERNSLKRLEKLEPKITLLTWMESPLMFRYVTVVETTTGRGIFAGVYSNLRLLKAE